MHRLITRASVYVFASLAIGMLIGTFAPDFALGAIVTALGIAVMQEGRRRE